MLALIGVRPRVHPKAVSSDAVHYKIRLQLRNCSEYSSIRSATRLTFRKQEVLQD
jgi:hypothetical protein